MNENVIKAALLGFGTVGTGVYKVLKNQEKEMSAKIGCKVEIKKILVRNIEKAAAKIEDASLLTSQWDEIINDPEIEIVIELMGGINPAKEYILSALKAGKHVVSANKDLIAVHGHELLDAAHESKVDFLFEAAVAGGIPIIRPLKQCLAGNHMTEVMGIVNGTTNFILTKMTQEGMEFKDALALATELGYAEADPTADIEGLDAGRKVAIMASIAFHSRVVFADVYTEGITKITPEDMEYAREMGRSIKLLGTSKKLGDDSFYALVAPFLVGQENPLYSVNGVFNSIFVHGNMLGDAMFYGSGAGKLPTASAVAADVVEAAKHLHDTIPNNWSNEEMTLMEPDSVEGRFFVRVKDTSLDEVDKAFGKVEAVIEPDSLPEEFGFITRLMTQGEYKARVKALGENVLGMIRVKD